MVNVQMLSELEEVIQYKLVSGRREAIKSAWWKRLQGCQPNVEEWHRILRVHSLVLTPQEDMKTWLKYASLCRKSGQLVSCIKIFWYFGIFWFLDPVIPSYSMAIEENSLLHVFLAPPVTNILSKDIIWADIYIQITIISILRVCLTKHWWHYWIRILPWTLTNQSHPRIHWSRSLSWSTCGSVENA